MEDLKTALNNLCDCEYPATAEQVQNRCSNVEVELANGETTTLEEIFEVASDPPERFESEDDLYNFVMSLAPDGSVGRKFYDDRGGGMDGQNNLSF